MQGDSPSLSCVYPCSCVLMARNNRKSFPLFAARSPPCCHSSSVWSEVVQSDDCNSLQICPPLLVLWARLCQRARPLSKHHERRHWRAPESDSVILELHLPNACSSSGSKVLFFSAVQVAAARPKRRRASFFAAFPLCPTEPRLLLEHTHTRAPAAVLSAAASPKQGHFSAAASVRLLSRSSCWARHDSKCTKAYKQQ